jgi:DNA-binding transcriptional LysR family regulator
MGLDRKSRKAQVRLQKRSPRMKLDWDDLRYFLAVIEHGSTKRAAAALRVDQTTCARRIGTLQATLGLELFTRESGRYVPNEHALDLVDTARSMQAAAEAFGDRANGRKRAQGRKIRVSSDEALTRSVIVPAVARFSQLYPDIQVEIDISNKRRDLQAGEADIALRGGLEPNEPGIVRQKLADDPIGVYCSWDYPSPPQSLDELPGHPVACLDIVRGRFEAAGLGSNVKHVVNSNSALRAFVAEGDVVGVLPAIVADEPPALRRCFWVNAPTGVWVVYAERLRDLPEIRKLGRLIADEFIRARARNATDRLPTETN